MILHYIDIMIEERRREEREECERERLRLLNSVGYSQPILIPEVFRGSFNAFHRLTKQGSFGHGRLQPCSFKPKVVARTEGEGQ